MIAMACVTPTPHQDPPKPPAIPPTDLEDSVKTDTTLTRGAAFSAETQLDASPREAFRCFTEKIDQWWHHHFKEKPLALYLEPYPGGRFVEVFDREGGGAVHAHVIYVEPGKELRLEGPLGLSGQAVNLVHTLEFIQDGATTRVHLEVRASGDISNDNFAAVQTVWGEFLDRFRVHCSAPPTQKKIGNIEQFPTREPERFAFGYFSHTNTGAARNYVHADDFSIDAPACIKTITWWGHPESGQDLENYEDFELSLLSSDARDEPGNTLFQSMVKLTEIESIRENPPSAVKAPPRWLHRFKPEACIALSASGRYFLAIAATRKDPDGDGWQWSDASPDTQAGRLAKRQTSFSRRLDHTKWSTIIDTDSAFMLEFVEVPLP